MIDYAKTTNRDTATEKSEEPFNPAALREAEELRTTFKRNTEQSSPENIVRSIDQRLAAREAEISGYDRAKRFFFSLIGYTAQRQLRGVVRSMEAQMQQFETVDGNYAKQMAVSFTRVSELDKRIGSLEQHLLANERVYVERSKLKETLLEQMQRTESDTVFGMVNQSAAMQYADELLDCQQQLLAVSRESNQLTMQYNRARRERESANGTVLDLEKRQEVLSQNMVGLSSYLDHARIAADAMEGVNDDKTLYQLIRHGAQLVQNVQTVQKQAGEPLAGEHFSIPTIDPAPVLSAQQNGKEPWMDAVEQIRKKLRGR